MNDKRYQVFVSSTYEDLKDERAIVINALLSLNCIPIGMENFNAANEDQFSVIKQLISSCDYYVLIVGGRYGTINNSTGKSYTEMEYDYAVEQNIPTVAFYHEDKESLPVRKTDQDSVKMQKLNGFLSKIQSKLCKKWNSAENLALNVILSLSELQKTHPRIGWVRADTMSSLEANNRIIFLQDENKSLKKDLEFYKEKEAIMSQAYQRHDDIVAVNLISRTDILGNPFGIELCVKPRTVNISWNKLFSSIGFLFLTPIQSELARSNISHSFCKQNRLDDDYIIAEDSFQIIISQLLVLGYIDIVNTNLYQGDIATYYILTKLGKWEYAQNTALKKTQAD